MIPRNRLKRHTEENIVSRKNLQPFCCSVCRLRFLLGSPSRKATTKEPDRPTTIYIQQLSVVDDHTGFPVEQDKLNTIVWGSQSNLVG